MSFLAEELCGRLQAAAEKVPAKIPFDNEESLCVLSRHEGPP